MFHNITKIKMVSVSLDSSDLNADEQTLLDCESALRKSFSVKEKHEYVVAINALMVEGASC